jgi:hypothetical protein
MRKLARLAVVPILVLLVDAKKISRTVRMEDKPRGEFISIGSMDEVLQSTCKYFNLFVFKIQSFSTTRKHRCH